MLRLENKNKPLSRNTIVRFGHRISISKEGHHLQGKYNGVIESGDITEAQRVILVEEGFLRPVMKGWYLCAQPPIRELRVDLPSVVSGKK